MLQRFFLILCFATLPVFAHGSNLPVESKVPVASYHLIGYQGPFRTKLTLTRVGHHIEGFVSCPGDVCETTHVEGSVNESDIATLQSSYVTKSGKRVVTETWTLHLNSTGKIRGVSKEAWLDHVDLHHDPQFAKFPFRLYMVVHTKNGIKAMQKSARSNSCNQKPVTNKFLIYENGKLVQTLSDFRSISFWCTPVAPKIQDINFDGYADIRIRRTNANSHTYAYYWLYDPKTGTFKRRRDLGGITEYHRDLLPHFNSVTKTIRVEWESSGTAMYGAYYYKWKTEKPS